MGEERNPEVPAITPYRTLMRKIAAGVLVGGWLIAAMVFVMTPAETEDTPSGLQTASASNSKRYRHELERIGGKAAVLAAELDEWFSGLWHGRALAGTLAVIAVGASLLIVLASRLPPLDE